MIERVKGLGRFEILQDLSSLIWIYCRFDLKSVENDDGEELEIEDCGSKPSETMVLSCGEGGRGVIRVGPGEVGVGGV
jgi:hypothetical protein